MITEKARFIGQQLVKIPRTQVKYMSIGIETPAVFIIYGNKVFLSIPKQRMSFIIENADAAESFRVHFENNWK
jgi:hypothetical protein